MKNQYYPQSLTSVVCGLNVIVGIYGNGEWSIMQAEEIILPTYKNTSGELGNKGRRELGNRRIGE